MDTPYRVELQRTNQELRSEYVIVRSGDDPLVRGNSLSFMYRLVELLNEEENNREGR